MDYIFVDDNVDEKSHQQLALFQREGSAVLVLPGQGRSSYLCDERSHHWNDSLMLRVANYKNTIIQYAIDNSYDELFFVDSDLVLHHDLIIHLEQRKKEIVSEIFWTQWHPNLPLEPNVWLFDEYDLVPKQLGEELTAEEMQNRQAAFLEMLKKPGLYEVGGLGACTLIQRSALLKGVNFAPIQNLTIHGEDRFFCIRAAVLGVELFVDTCFPAYHIYRESDLAGVLEACKPCETVRSTNHITLSMVVRNEEHRYLRRVLQSLIGHIDAAVIIDDASTDQTVRICEELLAGIPLHIVHNKTSMFADESSLRKLQWAETIQTKPDWILNLDADELIEDSFWSFAQSVMNNTCCDLCCFRLYDMWSETQYREDALWDAHNTPRTFLLRYLPEFDYQWKETPQHCGRFPRNCDSFRKSTVDFRIQHFGWAKKEDRAAKYKRYQLLDPGAVYGISEQYASILDANPTLLSWRFS
ncbi:MAG: glycosyltransferase family 2 protein [Clostridia bacterium]